MRIYFMGICGTAMGNAALLAREAGHDVIGADSGVYPPMSTVLAGAGIELHEGYDPARLERLAAELVVVGNAMSRGNPEVEWLLDTRRLPFTSLPAFLASHVLSGRRNVVIAGTHGKTTTTALTAYLLRQSGRDPGYLIGGVPQDPPTGSHLGAAADPFVIEGDEYDSAFFDKRSKFIHYAPHIVVMNNLEFDHADIFRDLADVQRTFLHLARIVPRSGWIVLNGDDDNLRALGQLAWTRVLRVGTGDSNDLRISGFSESATGARFDLVWCGTPWVTVEWHQPGLFNARNAAMASLAAQLSILPLGADAALVTQCVTKAERSGRGPQADKLPNHAPEANGEPLGSAPDNRRSIFDCVDRVDPRALGRFRGVKRRQEVLLETGSLTVIEDFGHHPTALAETLRSMRARYPGHVIHAAFEPRTNTSRTQAMQAGFMRALAQADEVYIGAVANPDKLRPGERFDAEAVIQFLDSQGVNARTAATNAGLLEVMVAAERAARDRPWLVIFFTNGAFDGIIGRFVRAERKQH